MTYDMNINPLVTTIIPTTALPSRSELLKRAVYSIRGASERLISIIVIVNGNHHDPAVCDWLEQQEDIKVEYISEPSLPAAILRGRQLVETPYFSFLDDDDEYMENTIAMRQEALDKIPEADLVVTNGYRRNITGDHIVFDTLKEASTNPLVMVVKAVWLCSCNALFRSSSVGESYFQNSHARAEWTWLAFNLAMDGKKVQVLDRPGFRLHDTPGSLSKTTEYEEAYLALYQRMLHRLPPAEVVRLIRRRISADWHDRSTRALARGDRGKAISAHLRSLLYPGGLRYLSYSRRLVLGG